MTIEELKKEAWENDLYGHEVGHDVAAPEIVELAKRFAREELEKLKNNALGIAYDSAPGNESKWFESVFKDAYDQAIKALS